MVRRRNAEGKAGQMKRAAIRTARDLRDQGSQVIVLRIMRYAETARRLFRPLATSPTACSLAADATALSVIRLYYASCQPLRPAEIGITTESSSSVHRVNMLVNTIEVLIVLLIPICGI
jgi:hypothetical protein